MHRGCSPAAATTVVGGGFRCQSRLRKCCRRKAFKIKALWKRGGGRKARGIKAFWIDGRRMKAGGGLLVAAQAGRGTDGLGVATVAMWPPVPRREADEGGRGAATRGRP